MRDETPRTYFADVAECWPELSASRRVVVERVREMLLRLELPFAVPEDTTTTYDEESGTVHLKIRHAADRTMVALLARADHIALHWPGGTLRTPAWDAKVADTLEALLTGHNVIRFWRHAGTTTTVDTEVWLPGRLRRALPRLEAPGLRAAALRRLPWPGSRLDVTLSYVREPALAPALESDYV